MFAHTLIRSAGLSNDDKQLLRRENEQEFMLAAADKCKSICLRDEVDETCLQNCAQKAYATGRVALLIMAQAQKSLTPAEVSDRLDHPNRKV